MAQVSIGQVENLEDLIRGLEPVRESLESSCRAQIAEAECKCVATREEMQNSEHMLESTFKSEQEEQQKLELAESALNTAESELEACEMQPLDEDESPPDCYYEEVAVAEAQAAVTEAQEAVAQAIENRQQMERRVECVKQALMMSEKVLEQTQKECASRLLTVNRFIETGKSRLVVAQQALEAYRAANPAAAEFVAWVHWQPSHGTPITPDIIHNRMNLSAEQQRLLQEYLYDRNPSYRNLVDKYRKEWVTANDDVERNIINRNARIHLSGEFAEQMARHALAPLGGKIETQQRTVVGDNGRYTKTDLIVTGLRCPVILGRGEGMGAPEGGSLAFEIKCGKADYLYKQKEHMVFQAEGHKQADAHCTLCSRDIHDLSPEEEKKLRDALRDAGSPIVGMLPRKNEIDQSCLKFILQGMQEE
jgi:hypothetical protein